MIRNTTRKVNTASESQPNSVLMKMPRIRDADGEEQAGDPDEGFQHLLGDEAEHREGGDDQAEDEERNKRREQLEDHRRQPTHQQEQHDGR